jgi:hypothetical protein
MWGGGFAQMSDPCLSGVDRRSMRDCGLPSIAMTASRGWILIAGALAVFAALASPAAAHPGHYRATVSQSPFAPEPPLEPTPQEKCGPGSRPETGIQGRVSPDDHASGRAAKGFTCNTEAVGSFGSPTGQGSYGGYKVERYVDAAGRECAYYDATLLFPTNIFDTRAGVNVLDMSDPSKPKLTDMLTTPAMLSPHESLSLNRKRGLLGAVTGNAVFYPGIFDLYDVSEDCRHPVLRASAPVGIFGHEGDMSPDGRTYWSASPGSETIVAIDISDPSFPVPIWTGNYDSHGLTISNDGNRAYVAGINSGLIILDTSEVQARVPDPIVREVARLQWESMSIPQDAVPVTIDGHPYVVEIDEFGSNEGGGSSDPVERIGAGRIIDIADERNPRVVSNLRLEVHQPENFAAIANDPGTTSPIQGYAGHYCNVPQRADPGIVACSMIVSGLRIFDIRNPAKPREMAYFNAPVAERATYEESNYAMSSPSFVPKRGEIWYTDGLNGFFAVRATNWPFKKCRGRDATINAVGKKTVGTRGRDVIVGRKGKDRIKAKGGRDLVCAKGGRDRVSGGPGRDRLLGQGGRDRLKGGRGRDRLKGGRGRDRLKGGAGRDTLRGGPGRDRLRGGPGKDFERQ